MSDEDKHITDEMLIAYADDPAAVRERPSLETHLGTCTECRSKLDDYRLLASAMSDQETWWMLEELEEGRGQLALREFVARCAAEDVAAERMLREVLESQYRFAYAKVAQRKRFHTGGVVRLLCDAAWTECPRDPRFAPRSRGRGMCDRGSTGGPLLPFRSVHELRGRA